MAGFWLQFLMSDCKSLFVASLTLSKFLKYLKSGHELLIFKSCLVKRPAQRKKGVCLATELPRGVAVWPVWMKNAEDKSKQTAWCGRLRCTQVFSAACSCPLHTEKLFVLLPSCWLWAINSLASGPGTTISYLKYLNWMLDLGHCDCRSSLPWTAPQECTSTQHNCTTTGLSWLAAVGSFWFKLTNEGWRTHSQTFLCLFGKPLFRSVCFRSVLSCLWMHWTFRAALGIHMSLTEGFRKAGKNRVSNSACQFL